MLLAFVHGGYRYEVKVQGPWYEHSSEFPSIYHARHFIKTCKEATYLMPGERLVLTEIETGRFEIINDNGYVDPDLDSPLWLKEGF
jgi:hypothetical protein